MTRLEWLIKLESRCVETDEAIVTPEVQISFREALQELLALAEAAQYYLDRIGENYGGHPHWCDIRKSAACTCGKSELSRAIVPLLEKVKEPLGIPSVVRKCNRHADCDKAEMAWRARHPIGKNLPMSFHCHDDCCEECFGN